MGVLKKRKIFAPVGIQTSGRPACSLITVLRCTCCLSCECVSNKIGNLLITIFVDKQLDTEYYE